MKGKVLVTGGTGYIGSHTIVDLIENGYDVVCVDNNINSDIKPLNAILKITGKNIPFYKVDLCDLSATENVFKQHPDIKGVIHFAALKAVGESVEKPILYFRNNLDSLINVLDLSIKYDINAFIFSSSCTVYGDVKNSPVSEDTPLQEAASPYGRTKQIGEQIITDTIKNTGLKSIFLRYFNPAGAHMSALLGESPINRPQNLVPVITETAIGKRPSFTVFGDDYPTKDGSCIRDYIHVLDLARAHTLAIDHVLSNKQVESVDTYNLGIGNGLTVFEIIKAFETSCGVKLNYQVGPRRAGDVMAIYADSTKAKLKLGWNPKFDVHDIMKSAWEWEKVRQ
jgi:UDP-glucose 4-epimerase